MDWKNIITTILYILAIPVLVALIIVTAKMVLKMVFQIILIPFQIVGGAAKGIIVTVKTIVMIPITIIRGIFSLVNKITNPYSLDFNKLIEGKDTSRDKKMKLKERVCKSLNKTRGYKEVSLQPLLDYRTGLKADLIFTHKSGIYIIRHSDGEEFYSRKNKAVIEGAVDDDTWLAKLPKDLSIGADVENPMHKMNRSLGIVDNMIKRCGVRKPITIYLVLAHTRNLKFNLDAPNGPFVNVCKINEVHKLVKAITKTIDKKLLLKKSEIKAVARNFTNISYNESASEAEVRAAYDAHGKIEILRPVD